MSFTPTTSRDPALATILALYRQLQALPTAAMRNQETPAHRAIVQQIRAAVPARTLIRGDEMIVVTTGCAR